MKSIKFPFFLLGALIMGCNTPPPETNPIKDEYYAEQDQIKNVLYDIFETAKAKDMDSLDSYHLNSPKFSKYDDGDVPQRQDYEMAKKTEEEFFTNISDFDFNIPDLIVDVFDDVAITTFTLEYSVVVGEETFTGKSRSTLVFVNDNGEWKIAHEHFSPLITNSM